MSFLRRHPRVISVASLVLVPMAWAALYPVIYESRDELFEIPKGTWARRMAGDKVEILPTEIRLAVGIKDILVLRNLDDVPQIFGPTLIMPGQTFRLPFDLASEYQFECSAHASGQMTVVVEETPTWPWQRVRWRTHMLLKSISPTSGTLL